MVRFTKFFALMFILVSGFVVTSCDDQRLSGNPQPKELDPEEERTTDHVIKDYLTHNWDENLNDEVAIDEMVATKTVYTVETVDGQSEITDSMKQVREPLLDSKIYLAKENYNILRSQVENKISKQEIRRHYELDEKTGIWQELDTLVAHMDNDDNDVFVAAKVTSYGIEIDGKYLLFGSDSIVDMRLVSAENYELSKTRGMYVAEVLGIRYKAEIDVVEKNMKSPKNFKKVPLVISTTRNILESDEIKGEKVLKDERYPISDSTDIAKLYLRVYTKAGDSTDVTKMAIGKRWNKTIDLGTHEVDNLGYQFYLNPYFTQGQEFEVVDERADDNWKFYGRIDKSGSSDENGVAKDKISPYREHYAEKLVYKDEWIEHTFENPGWNVEQSSTGLTSVASDREGRDKALLDDVVNAKFLTWSHSLPEQAILYTPSKDVVGDELRNATFEVTNDSVFAGIKYIEKLADKTENVYPDNFKEQWLVEVLTDWTSFEKNIVQLTDSVTTKKTSEREFTRGYWSGKIAVMEMTDNAQLDASKQLNKMRAVIVSELKYARGNASHDFGTIVFKATSDFGSVNYVGKDEAGTEEYAYKNLFDITYHNKTVQRTAPGKIYIVKSEEEKPTLEIRDKYLLVREDDVYAHFKAAWVYPNGTETSEEHEKALPYSHEVTTDFVSYEANGSASTAQPTTTLSSSERITLDDGWSYDNQVLSSNAISTLAGSKQNNIVVSTIPNNIAYNFGGVSVTFETLKLTANLVNSGATLSETTALLDTYKHSATMSLTLDNKSQSKTCPGTIYVTKDKQVVDHDVREVKIKVNDNNVNVKLKYFSIFNDESETSVDDELTVPRSLLDSPLWKAEDVNFSCLTSNATYTKTGSEAKTDGYFGYNLQTFIIETVAQLQSQNKTNRYEAKEPNDFTYTRDGKTWNLGSLVFKAEEVSSSVTLKSDTKTESVSDYLDNINVIYDDNTKSAKGYGEITVKKEKTVVGYQIISPLLDIKDEYAEANLTLRKLFSDDTYSDESFTEFFYHNLENIGRFDITDENANQTTSDATVTLTGTEAKTKGKYWKYDEDSRDITTDADFTSSTQTNKWRSKVPNHIVFDFGDGVSHDFGAISFNVTHTGASTSVASEDSEKTVHNYKDGISVNLGGNVRTSEAQGTVTVYKPVVPKKWGEYKGTNWCAGLSKDGNATVYNGSIRFEQGSIPFSVDEDGNVTFSESRFEPGNAVYQGATYCDDGDLVNCYTSEDTNFGLLWYRGTNDVRKMKSFTDLKLMHFNHDHNVFTPQRFGTMNADKQANGDIKFSIPGTSWTSTY